MLHGTDEEIKFGFKIGDEFFSSPVLLASGTAGYGIELEGILDLSKIGAVVTKGISPEPKEGNPTPRIAEYTKNGKAIGLLNSIGLQNPGALKFSKEIMPKIANLPTKIIVNVFGDREEDYAHVIKIIENEAEGAIPNGYELNLSCPNTKKGGIEFGVNVKSVEKIVSLARNETKKPIIVKFSPFSEILPSLVKVAINEGTDALTLTNTIPAAIIDRGVFFRGGLSGYPLKPIALRCVLEIAEKFPGIKIIGCGGIYTYEDALEFIRAGACAIQVGTATFLNPKTPEIIAEKLKELITKRN